MKVRHVGRVVSECLFEGYHIIFKVKMPYVPRVRKMLEVGKNLMNFEKRKKKDSGSVFKKVGILCGWVV